METKLRVALIAALVAAGFVSPPSALAKRKVVAIAVFQDPAPGAGDSVQFDNFDEPMVNRRGDVAFGARLSNSHDAIYFKRDGGGLELVAQGGDPVFGGAGTFSDDFDGPALNNAGKNPGTVFFVANNITGTTTAAVFQKKSGSQLTALVKQGDPVPKKHGVFVSFDDIGVNNKGDVAFIAIYLENTITKNGVFLRLANGTVSNILLAGDKLPISGCPACTFGGLDPIGVDGPWINDKGVVAFQVDDIPNSPTCVDPETNETTSCFHGSVFAKRPSEKIEPYVVIGDAIPGSDSTVETVKLTRPALDVDDDETDLALLLNGTTLAQKVLGSKKFDTCAVNGASAKGAKGEVTGFSPPAVDHERLQFNAELENNPDPTITNGVFTCKDGSVQALVAQQDPNPRGGTFQFFEEGSIGGGYVVFIHENEDCEFDPDVCQRQFTGGEGVYRVATDD